MSAALGASIIRRMGMPVLSATRGGVGIVWIVLVFIVGEWERFDSGRRKMGCL